MAGTSLENRQLGFSYFRLLPKETGVRPIVNLRRKVTDKRGIVKQLTNPLTSQTMARRELAYR